MLGGKTSDVNIESGCRNTMEVSKSWYTFQFDVYNNVFEGV